MMEEAKSPVEDVKPLGGCAPAVFHSFLGPVQHGCVLFQKKGS